MTKLTPEQITEIVLHYNETLPTNRVVLSERSDKHMYRFYDEVEAPRMMAALILGNKDFILSVLNHLPTAVPIEIDELVHSFCVNAVYNGAELLEASATTEKPKNKTGILDSLRSTLKFNRN